MGDSAPPRVSVIIPAYNCAAWIGRAIGSVLAQSIHEIEIVVIDDGSTDDLAAALRDYSDRVLLVRQKNSGAAAARNHGAAIARAEFLAFLDADDFWHPRKLEYQLLAFARWPHIALCYTACTHVDGDNSPESHDTPPPISDVLRPGPDFDALFAFPYLGTPAVMMRRSLFNELRGFREDLHSAEDVDLWLRACFGRETAFVAFPFTYIVPTPESLSARQGATVFRNNLKVIDDFCRDHPEFASASSSTVRVARAKVYENWASGELAIGNRGHAARLAMNSLRSRLSWRATYLMLKAQLGL